ncbi:uncharacterized protein [Montipora capricornis]|uniref:uncharacterized protein n=1 Tax=Montipora capricornis TaxID=246305 RepID=UPI0035F17AD2
MKCLPFKTEQHPIIPDNYLLAQNHLVSYFQRLRSKPELLEQYDSVIKEQLNAGFVELIDKSHDLDTLPGTVHYIPHKEVLKDDRITTKLRVVYDASAKSAINEPSLNDCLLPGPALTPLIFDVLLRFRLHKMVLIGDLQKAFLNIEVNPTERNLSRFLWVDDFNSLNPEVITLRFTRFVFGLVGSPFILNVTLRDQFARQALGGTFTKRTLLSSTARFYDPLGLLSPIILPLKCMIQEICHLKLGWDEALLEGLASRWKELLQDMWEVSSIVVPRCILGDVQVEDITSIQLHGFADASKSA